MSRAVRIVIVVAVACAAGWLIWQVTDSTSASYIMGVIGTAVGIAAVVVVERRSAPGGTGMKINGSGSGTTKVSARDGGVAAGGDIHGGSGGIHTGGGRRGEGP